MNYIYFDVHQHSWSVGGYDPDDEWSRDSSEGYVTIVGAKIVPKDQYDTLGTIEEIKDGDTIYLVWAQYSTGDFFGSDGGQYELCKVFKDKEEAEKEAERLRKVDDYSVPWNGYFKSLDDVFVKELIVGKNA